MPAPLEVQTKGVVDGVTGLVTQNAHALYVSASFDFQHLFSFELHQTRMGQIKRNRESRHTVGRKPFRRQPDVRLETNAAVVQFAIKTLYVRLEKRSLNPYRQIADTGVKQSLI